ncbi:MAG: tRNA pseudouridine(55) synthase TruB, partial [Burkholderiales bacterium]
KPIGLSSNAALQAAKRLFRAGKAGHAGTLDPLASGLLLVLFGEATKFAGPQLDADKSYLATVLLGVTTNTGDSEGEVVERRPVSVTPLRIEAALEKFRGSISQTPPMYSALKLEGKPLYLLARAGKSVERRPRAISINQLDQVSLRGDLLELRVCCSKGTYVRSLAEDIGRALGTGAHLAALRRTAAGGWSVEDAVTLDALAEMTENERTRRLLPLDALLSGLPRLNCGIEQEARLRNGQTIEIGPGLVGQCALHGTAGLIGVGQADGAGMLRPVRLTAPEPIEQTQAAEINKKTCE